MFYDTVAVTMFLFFRRYTENYILHSISKNFLGVVVPIVSGLRNFRGIDSTKKIKDGVGDGSR